MPLKGFSVYPARVVTVASSSSGEPLTNGDPVNPELVFDSFGDVVMVT